MENYRFLELAEKENGFEFYQAFRDEIDWIIGAKGDTCWFVVMQDQSVKETYIGTRKDGVWTDRRIKGKGKRKTEKEMPPAVPSGASRKGRSSCRTPSGSKTENPGLSRMRIRIITTSTVWATGCWTSRKRSASVSDTRI